MAQGLGREGDEATSADSRLSSLPEARTVKLIPGFRPEKPTDCGNNSSRVGGTKGKFLSKRKNARL